MSSPSTAGARRAPGVHSRVLFGGVVHPTRYLDTTPRDYASDGAITTSYESGPEHLVQTSTRLVQTTTLPKRKKPLCTSCTMVRENAASVRGSKIDSVAIARRSGAVFSGRLVHAVHKCGRSLWTNSGTSPIDSAASLLLGCVAYPERTIRGTFA